MISLLFSLEGVGRCRVSRGLRGVSSPGEGSFPPSEAHSPHKAPQRPHNRLQAAQAPVGMEPMAIPGVGRVMVDRRPMNCYRPLEGVEAHCLLQLLEA